MKRIVLTLLTAMLFVGVAMADNRHISVEKLPQKAQAFLKSYFADQKITFVTQDDDLLMRDYEVMLDNGTRIDFSSSGDWQEVNAGRDAVPSALVPALLMSYVKERYATAHIVRIDRDRRGWEIELSNGLELTFDKQYRLIDIDD